MNSLSPEAIIEGLVRQGVPRERARAVALGQQAPAPKPLADDRATMPWPLRFTLPWSYLISDNERYGVINGVMLLTSDYRRARGLIRDFVRGRYGEYAPANYPLSLVSMVYVPDETRAHDVCNFAKLTHDSLEKLIYTNDRWLWRTTWEHAGVDVDAPRAELTITPLP